MKNPNLPLILTVVILGIAGILLFAVAGPKNNSRQQIQPSPETTNPTLPIVTGGKNMRVALSAIPTSGYNQPGEATFSEDNGRVTVSLTLNPVAQLTQPQPAHIHLGSCPDVGDVVYPLTNVVNGKSETVLDATMVSIRSQFPLAINIHKSASESGVYTACGGLK